MDYIQIKKSIFYLQHQVKKKFQIIEKLER